MNSICHYFLCFVIYGFLGWLYESSFYSIQHRRLINTGFLRGCICPIYGAGALLALALLNDIENTAVLFVTAMVVCCTLEYFVSWLLEEMFDTRWWDYTNWPFNINGRVCLYGGLAFGTLIVLLIRYIHPFIEGCIVRLSMTAVYVTSIASAILIFADMLYTLKRSDSFAERLWFVREQPKLFEPGGGGLLGKNREFVSEKISQIKSFGKDIKIIKFIPPRIFPPKKSDIIQKIQDYIWRH